MDSWHLLGHNLVSDGFHSMRSACLSSSNLHARCSSLAEVLLLSRSRQQWPVRILMWPYECSLSGFHTTEIWIRSKKEEMVDKIVLFRPFLLSFLSLSAWLFCLTRHISWSWSDQYSAISWTAASRLQRHGLNYLLLISMATLDCENAGWIIKKLRAAGNKILDFVWRIIERLQRTASAPDYFLCRWVLLFLQEWRKQWLDPDWHADHAFVS
jgi:hypothetical protein